MTDVENKEMNDFRWLMNAGLELSYYEGEVCEGETECAIKLNDKGELSFFCDMDMGGEAPRLRIVIRRPFLLKDATITSLGENQIRLSVVRFDEDEYVDMATLVFCSPRVRDYMARMFGLITQE